MLCRVHFHHSRQAQLNDLVEMKKNNYKYIYENYDCICVVRGLNCGFPERNVEDINGNPRGYYSRENNSKHL